MPSETNSKLAVLASGGGSNADKICTYFKGHPTIKAGLIISNRKAAGVFQVAERQNIESLYLPKEKWSNPVEIIEILHTKQITHLVLAGFLLHVPDLLIKAFSGRIINIHPSLLPRHGGKGMYGHHVHEAVKNAGELTTGMTIHEVNEHYDEGKIILQKEIDISQEDDPKEIASKVLVLEHTYYSPTIERWITDSESQMADLKN